jgi:murein DD-endopeptidase MepM/ murein hydrolase activator NlpD
MLNPDRELRFGVSSMRSRVAAVNGGSILKFAAACLLAGASAACSDSGRFAENPFTNPFAASASSKVDRITTNSAATRAAPVGTVTAQPLPSALPKAPATPRVASSVLQNASPIGGTAAGWTAAGGTAVTVGANDTANSLSARYGVPVAAINAANGGVIRPGGQAIIPVYRGAGDGQAKSGLMNPPAKTVAAAQPSPQPTAPPKAAPAPTRPVAASAPRALDVPADSPPSSPAQTARPPAAQAAQPSLRQAAKQQIVPAKPVGRAAADDDDDEDDDTPPKKIVAAAPKAQAPQPVPRAQQQAQAPQVQAAPKTQPRVIPLTQAAPKPVAEAPKPVERAVDPVTTQSIPSQPPKAVEPAGDRPDFRWPARGRIITGFGSKTGNGDGIAIAVPEGTPVKAADGGVVAYAGEELKGYGKLVLVRHDNGYVSAYAHNGELNVKRGEKVTRGQTIAKSGATGNVTSPQLHFELRKGSTPVDPTKYLD